MIDAPGFNITLYKLTNMNYEYMFYLRCCIKVNHNA